MPSHLLHFEGSDYPDGDASDPIQLGLMQGAPPPLELRVTPDSYLEFPAIRWSLSHVRELLPTANLRRGSTPATGLSKGSYLPLHDLTIECLDGRQRTWSEALRDTYTDGLLVLHRGQVVYEDYRGALTAKLPHMCFSVTKSYIGTLAQTLVTEGVLAEHQTIPYYVPELTATAWQDATVRQVMDMETALAYEEVYDDPSSGVRQYMLSCGMRPQPAEFDGAPTTHDFLKTVKKDGTHGSRFAYKTVNTEVLAWVIARATRASLVELLSQRLWEPLGCDEDGSLIVDSAGTPMAGGGLSSTLRDLARFGDMLRREGDWNGKQIVPESLVADIRRGGDRDKFAGAGYEHWLGFSYRSMWWVTHNAWEAFEARGIHGQRLHVAPKADLVVARFASHPIATNAVNEPVTGPLLQAITRLVAE